MKKLLIGIVTILLVCFGLEVGAKQLNNNGVSANNKNLIIYNWGDYIDPKLIKKFEKQTGYHVIYETFDSNEAMYTKIKQGGTAYDICVPSDYMISKMRKANLLDKIDTKKIPNYKNIGSEFLHHSFDPKNTYSVPYFWGTLGIIYNDQKITGQEVQHWEQLWSPRLKNNLLLIDSARDVFAVALITQGKSVNTTNYSQLKQAQHHLQALTPNVKAIIADEMKMYMEQDEAAVGVTYSGDAREMMSVNHHLHYVVPSEGSNIWFDNMVIPKSAKNKQAAYQFINFMLQPENAAKNAEYVGYANPNRAAKKLLPRSVTDDQQFYPPESTMEHLQTYKDLPRRVLGEYNDLFLEFKMFKK